ncbi:MAG TPA: GNAT family N-acetyltransferase [Actinomycetota bacterium]|nr:GNAT family N-acetyltransferase [Actinomycetota bacterium]
MPLAWVEPPSAFGSAAWPALVEADPEATPFHGPRFLKPYWEELAGGRLSVAVVDDGARPVAVAAFEVAERVLSFLGGSDVTDYLGPAGVPEETDRAAKELMAGLAGRSDWDVAELGGLPRDGRWLGALGEAAAEAGFAPEVVGDGVAPFLPLPGSFDAYLAGLASKRRHEMRRKRRRLEETFPGARLVDATADTAAAALGRFAELHRQSRGRKGRFMVPGMELFFRRVAEELLPDGTLRLALLEVDGRALAAAIGFRWRDRFLLYNSGYDHAAASAAPGMVLVEELIRSSIEEGLRGFDFLKGDLPYKYRFGARRRRIGRLVIRR